MGENKFRTFRGAYSLLVMVLGISFLMADLYAIGVILMSLSLAHCYTSRGCEIPYLYTMLIHIYGIGVWLYIIERDYCPSSVLTRLSLFLILSEVWIMLGTLFNKSLRQKEA